MKTLWQDVSRAGRMCRRRSGFTALVVLTLGLAIGATAAIFTVVDALLLRALPYPQPDRLVVVREVGETGRTMAVAVPNFDDVEAQSTSFAALGHAAGSFPLVVTGGREPVRARVTYVSARFFEVMGVQPRAGRTFRPEETRYGGPTAVLVSDGFWQRVLGAPEEFAATTLVVDGVRCPVIGIMPATFNYPPNTDVWITRSVEPASTSRTAHNLPVIGRLRDGVSLAQAQADVSTIGRRLRQTWGRATNATDFALIPLQRQLTQPMRDALWVMLGAVAVLLLIACANVSNLIMAQLASRQIEFAVRSALGASRWRLARQLVTENLLLTLVATLVGIILARWGVAGLLALEGGNLPPLNRIAVDARILLFAGALAAAMAGALALPPLWQLGRRTLAPGLKGAGRGTIAGERLHATFVVVQIALTLVLLTAAGLLGRGFLTLVRTDPGFQVDDTVAMTVALPSTISVAEDERLRAFYVQVLERLEQLPGTVAVGGINALPLAGQGANGTFLIDDDPARRGDAEYRVASAGYFRAMGIPLLRGRMFDARDTVASDHVAVISDALARRYWPGQDPIGQRIQFGNMDRDRHLLHVVGVVGDVRNQGLDAAAAPAVYAYSLQRPQWWQVSRLSIVLRGSHDVATTIAGMRAAVQALRADVPVSFRTLAEVQSSSLDRRRFSLVLFGVFAVVALIVATLGVYGVTSYAVSQRTPEIGIRMALGARRRDVVRLVLVRGLVRAAVGVASGMVGATLLTRVMKSLLFEVSTTDPLTFGLAALLLAATTVAASWIPARRASRLDPLAALRTE